MPTATSTFRVFVSSTFEDLKEERDALQREVFPRLRTLCEQHGARFQAIDLRWGVRDEAALDQQTVEICLREIRRCQATGVRPNFIVLLGDRYGWQPLPARIPAAEFDALLPYLPPLATQWYWLDENAVPQEYCLQPRTAEFVTPAAWMGIEQPLRQFLAGAARSAGLGEQDLIKYEASATHQEILAGLGETKEDRQHVFGFFRGPRKSAGAGNVLRRLFGRTGARRDERLKKLKAYVRNRLPGDVSGFDAGDTAALCNAVFDQLRKVIEVEVKRFEDRPALDLEVEAHDRFAEERCRIFTGRQAVLDKIADYIRGPECRPLVLHGESGSGKSAVMGKASQEYKGPGRMIRRFIGASPESASGHALLTSLCKQIAPGETPVDYAKLEEAFKDRLAVATADQPLVVFVDALDQLAVGDPARDVTWLPPELPPHVKVIVSITDDGERLPEGLPVQLERMLQSEGGQALDELLREARRTLQPWQRETVLAHFERCGLPLYLKLAAEECRHWKSYTPEDACTLDEGVAGVIDTLFDRLASNANHGPTLVERSLGYLAVARYGLTEDEVLDVLTADDTVWNDFDQRKHHEVSERRLPVVVWSRLSLDLKPYLTERAAPGGTVITFYHRQLAERVAGRFLTEGQRQARHALLAHYLAAQPLWLDGRKEALNERKVTELPFQQHGAELWKEAEQSVTDVDLFMVLSAQPYLWELLEFWAWLEQYVDPVAAYRAVLEKYEKDHAVDFETSNLIGKIANFHFMASRYETAVDLLRRVVKIVSEEAGPEAEPTLVVMNNLGLALFRSDHCREGEEIFKKILAVRERTLGRDAEKTLRTRINLGDLMVGKGETETLKSLIERVDENSSKEERDVLARELTARANDSGPRELGEKALRDAVRECVARLGPDHPMTLSALNNLGVALSKKCEFDEAEVLYRQALAGRERALGRSHPETLVSVLNLATLLLKSGDYDAAGPLFERALAGFEHGLGSNNEYVKMCRHALEIIK